MSDKLNPTLSLTERQQAILQLFVWGEKLSSGHILEALSAPVSIATVKRDLTALGESGYVVRTGANKDSEYALTEYGLLQRPFNLGAYYVVPETERAAIMHFNGEIFSILRREAIFLPAEIEALENATATFKENARNASDVLYKKELERFVIEFSWKSSKIEGNTYTLFETERLIKEGLKKNDRSEFETSMILDHKKAYEYVLQLARENSFELTKRNVEDIHALVVRDLGIASGLRRSAVGISGSLYRPLAIASQIEEQLNNLIACINAKDNPYEKALIAVLGESYLQPFEDGNKRTARVLANGVLLQAGYAPLSYRSVDEQDYKEACLVFYEQNSLEPFKKLFIEQYIFAANTYNIAKAS